MTDYTDKDILNYLLAFASKSKDEILKEMNEKYKTIEEFKKYIPNRYSDKTD